MLLMVSGELARLHAFTNGVVGYIRRRSVATIRCNYKAYRNKFLQEVRGDIALSYRT